MKKPKETVEKAVIPMDEPKAEEKASAKDPIVGPGFSTIHPSLEDAQAANQKSEPRFLGDPTHAQALLADPERRNEAIKYAAEHGWNRLIDGEDGKVHALLLGKLRPNGRFSEGEEPPSKAADFSELTEMEKFGLYHHVASIVANPHQEPYAGLMPNNHERKAYRALDDALRDALGFARFRHG